jgi:phage baseplate assembly protein W
MNLIRTQLGERFFQPILGSSIESSLFELHNSDAEAVLPDRIKNVLSNYEPRIQVLNVEVTSNEDTHELGIEITYNIVGLPLPTQSLDFILQPSRL